MGIFDFLGSVFRKIVPSWNERQLKRMQPVVDRINELESKYSKYTDEQLKQMTPYFKRRLAEGATLDELLPDAFAVVRETAKRTLGMRHFDVQLIGGIALHEGMIAEMKTGEGKTLVATLPIYLNALEGRGVHLVTVNDYLARRDSEWMGEIYKFLGLSVGLIVHGLDPAQRREAYAADVTYGTNNEFGFDYLRDNMALHPDELVQRELNYAIIDEVDSILIDEARTPLIISGPAEKSADLYVKYADIARKLQRDVDYTVDEKAHTISITEEGIAKAERMAGVGNLYDPRNMAHLHYLTACIKAKELYHRDKHYVVHRGEIVIVDEFTGRMMEGRRYSDGIHQAIEAKEGVKVRQEFQTLASITFQNYFRMYRKLAGMTGTAATEAREFADIYNLDVLVVPTNKPMIRVDLPDKVYRTKEEKYEAVLDKIEELHTKGQPVLVGTISIDTSEYLAKKLRQRGIKCEVLNAKHHEREAQIIAKAGQYKAVTIATNMAGRGTDIVLDEKAKELGGLYIIGTERHESRRIDNQLRGRAGRQGDMGYSEFYISMEDDIMRLFGGPQMLKLMDKLGWQRGEPLDHPMLSRAIERAQRRVENHHFEIRKQVLKYDDVMNEQRTIIYKQRRMALTREQIRDEILDIFRDTIRMYADIYLNEDLGAAHWDYEGLAGAIKATFDLDFHPSNLQQLDREELVRFLENEVVKAYEEFEKQVDVEALRAIEKFVLLHAVDEYWKEHLHIMDCLQEGIGLRGYAGKDPLVEYKIEARDLFNNMIANIKETVARHLFHLRIQAARETSTADLFESRRRDHEKLSYERRRIAEDAGADKAEKRKPVRRKKIKPNEPCPCGSGKKYKKCCGAPR